MSVCGLVRFVVSEVFAFIHRKSVRSKSEPKIMPNILCFNVFSAKVGIQYKISVKARCNDSQNKAVMIVCSEEFIILDKFISLKNKSHIHFFKTYLQFY